MENNATDLVKKVESRDFGYRSVQVISLILIIIGVLVAVFVVIAQLKQLDAEGKARNQTIIQIKKAVDDIKADNQKNTERLQCLLALHSAGTFINNNSCAPLQSSAPQASQVAQSPSPPPSTTSSAPPTSQPPVAPQPDANQSILDTIKGIFN